MLELCAFMAVAWSVLSLFDRLTEPTAAVNIDSPAHRARHDRYWAAERARQ